MLHPGHTYSTLVPVPTTFSHVRSLLLNLSQTAAAEKVPCHVYAFWKHLKIEIRNKFVTLYEVQKMNHIYLTEIHHAEPTHGPWDELTRKARR